MDTELLAERCQDARADKTEAFGGQDIWKAYGRAGILARVGLYYVPRVLSLPEGLKEVAPRLFENSPVERLAVPSSVERLGGHAFFRCERLCEVVFQPDSRLERIGEYCFAGCSLRQLVVPRSVRQIGDFAFCECRDLCRVDLEPDSLLAYVGEFAFWLTSMDLQNIRRVTPGDQRQL